MRPWAYSTLAVAGTILLWHLLTDGLQLIPPLTFPSPISVVEEGYAMATGTYNGTSLWDNVKTSVGTVLLGWSIGALVGIPIGIAIGWHTVLRAYLGPVIELVRPIPPPAWIPFAVLWFGIGASGRVFVIVIAALMPCIVNAYGAIRSRDPILDEAATCLGAGPARTVCTVVVPTMSTDIVAGVRIALGNAWMTVVAAELVASTAGLGFVLIQAQNALQPAVVLVSMTIIGIVGAVFSVGMSWAERRVGNWR